MMEVGAMEMDEVTLDKWNLDGNVIVIVRVIVIFNEGMGMWSLPILNNEMMETK